MLLKRNRTESQKKLVKEILDNVEKDKKGLRITVTIKNCEECRWLQHYHLYQENHRLDHSGSFTPGGAQPICGHYEASKIVGKLKGLRNDNPNDPETVPEDQRWHWTHRVVDLEEIPDWCPLKNGCGY